MDKYKSVAICVGAYLLKWEMISQHMNNSQVRILPGDNVNIFINFECILKNLSMTKTIQSNVMNFKQDLVIDLEAAILNLVAHYRGYFKKEKCNPRIFLYYTDLGSDVPQQMSIYNKYYRSYYNNQYITNPNFKEMGKALKEIIIPEVELILKYIPNCYFIKSKNFDSSIIPSVISSMPESSGYKNVIISGDVFDTLYLFNLNFAVLYIKRRFQYFNLASSVEEVVRSIVKNESPFDLTIFNSELYFRLLLAIKGSKIRNIRSAKGFGYGKFMNLLENGIKDGVVLQNFESLNSIIQLFPEKYAEDIKNAFICTSLETQMALISEADIADIKSQIIDKIDPKSVESLNNRRFLNYPINLQMLLE